MATGGALIGPELEDGAPVLIMHVDWKMTRLCPHHLPQVFHPARSPADLIPATRETGSSLGR